MDRELHKMEFKLRVIELGGVLYLIDTMSKSWLSDENNTDTQDCIPWQTLIRWNMSPRL